MTVQTSEKAVKEHRVHKYAWKDFLLKRQTRAQEGAKKGGQDALLEERTSSNLVYYGYFTSSFLNVQGLGSMLFTDIKDSYIKI